jgi:hypothetical protein
MTPAEFVCWREYLGLDRKWVASQFDVTERTVKRWEEGSKIPVAAEHAIGQWVEHAHRFVSALTIQLTKIDGGLPYVVAPQDDCVDLVDGMPAKWHRMIAARVAERTGLSIVWKY